MSENVQERDYFETLETFLREINGEKVKCLSAVAILDNGKDNDIVANWNCSPFGMMSCANVLYLHASYEFNKINGEEEIE